jgi:hypothetical protein
VENKVYENYLAEAKEGRRELNKRIDVCRSQRAISYFS